MSGGILSTLYTYDLMTSFRSRTFYLLSQADVSHRHTYASQASQQQSSRKGLTLIGS